MMEAALMGLLEYRDVVAAVASTQDGLVVASAGVEGDDAETLAAAGSAVVMALADGGSSRFGLELPMGGLHLALGQELMLVVLAEAAVPAESVSAVMDDALRALEAAVSGV